jgi:hypothetical protein
MKKLLLLGIAALLATGLYSNPNPDPELHIGNFAFTGSSGWRMTMLFVWSNPTYFDSIVIQSNEGRARMLTYESDYLGDLYFTDQDISQPMTINPNGDVIVLTGYTVYGFPLTYTTSQVAFGNVPNPMVVAPLAGQSIERFEPTICFYPSNEIITINKTQIMPNDTSGAFGTIRGIVYDKSGHPLANQKFYMDLPFTTDASGHYSTRVYSRIITWNHICYENWPNHFTTAQVSTVSYTMIPDSLITRDINLLDSLLTGIPTNLSTSGSGFKIFPNPVTDAITISYTSDLSTDSGDLHIDIYNTIGSKVMNKDLENHLGVISLPINFSNGIYVAELTKGGKVIGSTRFIVNRTE